MQDIVISQIRNNLLLDFSARQKSERLSDSKFAKKLRVSRELWQKTRTQKRSISITILSAFARTYPGIFDLQIIAFLRDGNE